MTPKLVKSKKNLDHDHGNKYITTQEINRLTAENLAARLKQENLARKDDTADLANRKKALMIN